MHNSVLNDLKNLASKDLTNATAMPKELYSSNEILNLEEDLIFSKEWICVGRENEIPEVGDYFTFELGKQPLIVLRDKNKNIKVLSNICLHRMMKIVDGKGNKKNFTCPYHAWTYNLDGNLVKAKYMDKTECFEKNHLKLPELKTEIFLGWIYVTLNQNPESLSENLKSLQTMVTPYKMENYINICLLYTSPSPRD